MPAWLLPALSGVLGLGQLGAGIYGMLKSDDISPEMQRYLDILQTQASEGIPLAEERAMLASGSRDIGAQAASMQRRGAAAVASRGMARSSVADSMISSVNRTQAEMFSDLQDSIRRLDQQTKLQAQGQLGGALGMTESMKLQQQQAAGQMIGGGIGGMMGSLEDLLTLGDPSELEEEDAENHRS
jgi:hypothetical protein